MKKILLFSFAALVSISIAAQVKGNKEPYLIKTLGNETIKTAEVETTGGNISVAGVNASEARVEVYISPNYSGEQLTKEEIQQRLNEKYDLSISVVNNKIIAKAKPKERNMDWKRALNISFKIFVSKDVSTDLSTSGGNISLENLTASQKFSTSGGNLWLDKLSGKLDGSTSGGNIHIESSTNDMDLSTSGGNIEASNCEGRLRLTTSGGSLYLKQLKGDIEATTSGGNVEGSHISGELVSSTSGGNIRLTDLSCSLECSTSGGNINISIIELGKYVKIGNSGGNVDLTIPKGKGVDLDLEADKIRTDSMADFNGKVKEDEVSGKLNGGGISVKVRASSGRIHLGIK